MFQMPLRHETRPTLKHMITSAVSHEQKRVGTLESVGTQHLHQPRAAHSQVCTLKGYTGGSPPRRSLRLDRSCKEARSISLKREVCRVAGAPRIMKTLLRTQLPATCHYRVGGPRNSEELPDLSSSSPLRAVSQPVLRKI